MTLAPTVAANGAAIPAVGLGTWKLAGDHCSDCVAAALQAGYRHIDTAAMYENEEAVGRGLRAGGVARDDIWVTTKVWRTEWRRDALLASARASLERLGLSQVDLLLIHWPDPEMVLDETIDALNEAKALGYARNIGVSNFPPRMFKAAVARSAAPIVANQCEYHPMLDQSAILVACREARTAFVSYSPLGRGELMAHPLVVVLAGKHARTPAQIILRWHIQQGVIAIPRSSNPERIAANLRVFDFALDADDMARLGALKSAGLRIVNPDWGPDWAAG